MQIVLLIPDLIPPQPPGGLIDIYRDLNLPNLAFLLGRATHRSTLGASLESWLCRAFDVAGTPDLPIAALTLLADHGDPGNAYWLRVDPVHLEPQRDQLVLSDSEALGITRLEADQLIETLNTHFAGSAYSFHTLHPERWHARMPTALDAETCPLPEVSGRGIGDYMPGGNSGSKLRKLMNEVQMLLHDHAVNQARETQGLPTINSIWPWGGGCLPPVSARPFSYLWAIDPLAQGLALASRTPWSELPANARTLLDKNTTGEGTHLVVLDGLRSAAAHGDHAGWQAALRTLEEKWFKPLTLAYRRGQIGSLDIYALDARHTTVFTLPPRARWKFWRRAKSLKHYAAAS